MMSPRLPLALVTHARRARRLRLPALAAVAACTVAVGIATAATPVAAADAGAERQASRSWNPFFEQLRPVASVDPRRVIVVFDDPSLGAWSAAGVRRMGERQQRAWLRSARRLQQQRLDLLAGAGVQFQVEHRYLRVINGASIVVHGDGAQLLRSARGVKAVVPVRTLWPAAIDADGAAGAAAVAGAAPEPEASDEAIRVAVLDTGVDATHPAVAGHVGAAFDAIPATPAKQPAIAPDAHGTAVAGTVLRGAGEDVDIELLPIQVLAQQPSRDGIETVLGDSDDLLAGLEHAVDPNGDGSVADAAHVAVVAASSPYAGFAGSPEDEAVRSADALGTVVVAAAGNDGASGDDVGTIGSVAASDATLAIGAVDLRGTTPAADVRVHGSGIDETFEGAPVLTAGSELPGGELAIEVVDAAGGEVVDYLDADLKSRVTGAVALVASRDGVTIAAQVRAAADAGAIAVLVAANGADAAAGTIDVRGADIPAIALDRDAAGSLREAVARGERLALTFAATSERNPAFGEVAGFSSAGPRLDGVGRPDLVAPGVGMAVAGDRGSWRTASGSSISAGWAAGAVAALRDAHPEWDTATVRAALLGTARPLGEVGDRPGVRLQGAGLVDAARAANATWLAGSGRIEFGSVAPGDEVRRPLDLGTLIGEGADDDLRILLDDGGADAAVTPLLDGDELVLAVDEDAADGHVGGWLVLPDHELRIPWSATVRDASATTVPLRAELTNRTLAPVAGPGAFASTLTLSIGGDAEDGSLGLAAVQRLEVRLIDAKGKDRGAIGGLDQALPGIYTFGLTGVGPDGKRLPAGAWQLKVRYVPAADPDGEWRDGPIATIAVQAARRAK